jgi:hypothetical protein
MTNLAKTVSCLVIGACALCLPSCKKETRVDASRPLQQSFQASEPEVRQAIGTATTGLKAGHYTEAARSLQPVLAQRNLTPEQRQAIGLALRQISQAVADNPSLDSKELYELRARMFRASRGERF